MALKNGLAYAAGGSNCWTNFPTLWSVIDLSVPTSPVLVGAAPVLPFTGPLDLDTPPVLLRGFEIVALQLGSEPSTHWIELASSLLRGITTGAGSAFRGDFRRGW
ncbi:MAG: hypothetical protein IPK72_08960 [Candidatus Eisenbacteria bacterium]|nr:hypothetical protein [Candidatus Eisenbacteria bacterium]